MSFIQIPYKGLNFYKVNAVEAYWTEIFNSYVNQALAHITLNL